MLSECRVFEAVELPFFQLFQRMSGAGGGICFSGSIIKTSEGNAADRCESNHAWDYVSMGFYFTCKVLLAGVTSSASVARDDWMEGIGSA